MMPPKVLQISNYMYPSIGGIEQVAGNIASVLNRHGISQQIICFNTDASGDGIVCRRGETIRAPLHDVEVIRCGSFAKIRSQSVSLTYPRELRRTLDEFNPNIVIFHYPNPYVAHLLLRQKQRDFKLILYWHADITKQKYLKLFFHGQNLKLIRRASVVVGATPLHIEKSAYAHYFADKGSVVPYMIDEKRLELSADEAENAQLIRERYGGRTLAFFIGRHVTYKGLEYLIKASRRISSDNIRFLIAGVGPLTEKLKKEARNDIKIEFLGPISDSLKRTYYSACDMICFPSITRNEAFGLALAEGMYFGKPAITFSIPGSGVNYINLNGETGIECPNGDINAYAEAILSFAGNTSLRDVLGNAAKRRIEERFTSSQFDSNIMHLLNTVLQGR